MERILRSSSLLSSINNQTLLCCDVRSSCELLIFVPELFLLFLHIFSIMFLVVLSSFVFFFGLFFLHSEDGYSTCLLPA